MGLGEDVDLKHTLDKGCQSLPLFPLPDLVFFPDSWLPLHVFEPRYQALIRHCLDRDGVLAVPRLKEGWRSNYEGRPAIHEISGFGRIVQKTELPDGRWFITLQGLGRVRIEEELPPDHAFRLAKAEVVPEPGVDESDAQRMVQNIRLMVGQLLSKGFGASSGLPMMLEEARTAVAFVHRVAHACVRDPDERQVYLELNTLEQRVEMVSGVLMEVLARTDGYEA